MIKSKSWSWEILKDNEQEYWKNPSIESFYLVNRWKSQNKSKFLDLGCGLGRHSVLFGKNGFKVYAFDLSENAIKRTKSWMESEKIEGNYKVGDMLELPYKSNSMECILARNVISHTDTEGVKKIISEIYRVLKNDGECYLTLRSKDSSDYKKDYPVVDENTKIMVEEGPENGIQHFYADYELISKMFNKFTVIDLKHIGVYYEDRMSYHYHILIKKT